MARKKKENLPLHVCINCTNLQRDEGTYVSCKENCPEFWADFEMKADKVPGDGCKKFISSSPEPLKRVTLTPVSKKTEE